MYTRDEIKNFQRDLQASLKCFGCWAPVVRESISPYCMSCVCDISNGKLDPHYVKMPPKIEELPVVEEEPLWKQLAKEYEQKLTTKSKEPEVKKPQPRAADIFAPTYPRTIESVFKTLVPKEKTATFSLLQALYTDNPDRFRVISGIHQNSMDDKLHLSLAVDCGKSSYTLHVYGFWKNYFRVGMVTMKETDDDIRTIATF